ncbi:uncharacterized protein LOC141714456 [Apium graveolens]|uniref:uncharacterized protein LOC141714456 n=1 Tax=Apium graveolens TaxID=4045 RepID=UPI003D79CE7B
MVQSPLLAKPDLNETLYLYLAVSENSLSAVLVKEELRIQNLIYYVSKILHGAELNYLTIEKFALALVMTSRKLRPYFQAHKIELLINQPLRNIIHSPKASVRLIKWAIELGEFDIKYKPQMEIKAQALADFVVESEYEALITGLGLAGTLRVKNLKVYGDSKLVVSQVKGEFEARDETMAMYVRLVRDVMTQFDECHIIDIKLIAPIGLEGSWIDPIKAHLQTAWLPSNAMEARQLSVRALRYSMIDGILYKRSFIIPYLRCLRPDEARPAMEEVHEGICGQHLGGRAIAHKITRLGFYWPEMMADAKEYAKRCDCCKKHAPVVKQPPEMLTSINSPIPFAMWEWIFLGLSRWLLPKGSF